MFTRINEFVYTNYESITDYSTQVFTHWVQTMPGKWKIKEQRENAANKCKNHEKNAYNKQHLGPISRTISEVVNFLVHLFKEATITSNWMLIPQPAHQFTRRQTGIKWDSTDPLVSRLLKEAFNQQPPKQHYEVKWDVTKVLNYIDSLGESVFLTL